MFFFPFFSTTESTIILAGCRGLQLLTHILCLGVRSEETSHSVLALLNKSFEVIYTTLDFIWVHMDHYMDSVRHSANNMMQNIVQLGTAAESKGNFCMFL